MNKKIRDFVKEHKLGKVVRIKRIEDWHRGKRYNVIVQRLIKRDFTFYIEDDEIVTVKNVITGKIIEVEV